MALERLDHLEDSLPVLAELVVQLEQGRKTVLDGLIGSCGSEDDLFDQVDDIVLFDFDFPHVHQHRRQLAQQEHGHFAEGIVA